MMLYAIAYVGLGFGVSYYLARTCRGCRETRELMMDAFSWASIMTIWGFPVLLLWPLFLLVRLYHRVQDLFLSEERKRKREERWYGERKLHLRIHEEKAPVRRLRIPILRGNLDDWPGFKRLVERGGAGFDEEGRLRYASGRPVGDMVFVRVDGKGRPFYRESRRGESQERIKDPATPVATHDR